MKKSKRLTEKLKQHMAEKDRATELVLETKDELAEALLEEAGLKIGDKVVSNDRWSWQGKPGLIKGASVRIDRHGDAYLRLNCQLVKSDGKPGTRHFTIGKWSLPNG